MPDWLSKWLSKTNRVEPLAEAQLPTFSCSAMPGFTPILALHTTSPRAVLHSNQIPFPSLFTNLTTAPSRKDRAINRFQIHCRAITSLDSEVSAGSGSLPPIKTARQMGWKRLWDAADQLRANSGLTSAQYSTRVLGLIFLRFADVRFAKTRAGLEKMASSSRRGSRVDFCIGLPLNGTLSFPQLLR